MAGVSTGAVAGRRHRVKPLVKRSLLDEGIVRLGEAFGHDYPITVSYVLGGEAERLFRVCVHVPMVAAEYAREALRRFDETWWLEACEQSDGTLVFDYVVEAGEYGDDGVWRR